MNETKKKLGIIWETWKRGGEMNLFQLIFFIGLMEVTCWLMIVALAMLCVYGAALIPLAVKHICQRLSSRLQEEKIKFSDEEEFSRIRNH
jgi:hypothetical protein